MRLSAAAAVAAALIAASAAAHAHVTLETAKAPAGSTYKAVLRVGHGCKGSPTTAIRVRIPEGVIAVKPMPKPGWTLQTTEGPYSGSYTEHGRTVTRGITEITWTGGPLPDAWYDEFVFRARLPDGAPGTAIHFPVVQDCETGAHRWIAIPEPGKTAADHDEPAPAVVLMPKP
ncbi:YcnI family protein [Azospirillum halopraeferens]|uniref:YcnI family copper-binding membrane protein n=1 Tax=Azospirillum halopraeferens TaxID=34010 RepID=UPI00041ACEED|nr:YcnI family protein [Azospirillum halopraeferens]